MDINAFWHDVLSKKREALRDYITAQRLIDVQSYAWIHRRAFDLWNSDSIPLFVVPFFSLMSGETYANLV